MHTHRLVTSITFVLAGLAGCAGTTVATDDAGSGDAAPPIDASVDVHDASVDAAKDTSPTDATVTDVTSEAADGGGDADVIDGSTQDVKEASTFDASALEQDIIVYWKFDEGTGTSAADSTGGNDTGTLQTGASWGTGVLGDAVVLDGVSGYVQAQDLVQNNVTAYSLAMWFKTTSTAQQVLFSNRGETVTTGNSLTLEMSQNGASGELQWLLDRDGWAIGVQSSSAYNDGAWHHVVATWAAPANTAVDYSQFSIYVDGSGPITTTNMTINCNCGGIDSPISGAQGAQIGTSSSWQIYFSGSIDELGAWSRALTSSDAALLYNSGNGLSLY
jgi:hypothetical protein